jgi:hypothetical protein
VVVNQIIETHRLLKDPDPADPAALQAFSGTRRDGNEILRSRRHQPDPIRTPYERET